MLLKPLIVHPFDIRYRTDAAVVFVVGVTAAVVLIGINDGQNLDKMLPRVVLIINQFVIEAQDLGTQKIGIALIINLDMLLQLFLGLLLLFQHFSIQGVSDDFRKPSPSSRRAWIEILKKLMTELTALRNHSHLL